MTWHFLKNNNDHSLATEKLAGLLQNLRNLIGESNGDPAISSNRYLMWTEEAELRLREIYQDREASQKIHSERYWQIRAISASTHRPHSLIRLEIEDKIDLISALIDQMEHYRNILTAKENESLILLDTNVLVHGKPFEMVDWQKLAGSKYACLVFPLAVIDELDKLKDTKQHKARVPLASLDRLISHTNPFQRARARDGVHIQITDEPLGHTRLSRVDDEIIRQASYFQSVSGKNLKVITRDRGMKFRAEFSGISAEILPKELERSKTQEGENDGKQ
ncbi:PIN domain-containing protein [Nocardiopsis sp. N85]|uniref:PIN domain-containing protein n=1 Tax=Nocardiopsis sp. N85 TaxID=3029400 RepID=UPI00237F9B85|nr:PIN domain-containing protein [Nocardiopsis sp. N85]MDE3721808.1 PIN domain-containing protein [Nocardiopsis sp. N85]